MKKTKSMTRGETHCFSQGHGDNPKLSAKKLSDGRMSLYLEYYGGYRFEADPATGNETMKLIRSKKYLNLYIYENPRSIEERQHNKDVFEVAKQIRYESEQEYRQRETGHRIPKKNETNFLKYFEDYIDNYTKKDLRNLKLSYRRFVDFLNDTPKYRRYANNIRPAQIDRDMILSFVDYLQKRSYGEGANTLYKRFKKVVKYATEHDVFMKNPCAGISIKTDQNAIKKDILSLDEIRTLVNTPFQGNQNIKRAFTFSLYTGLRWCDVRELTFGNVDYSNMVLKFTQVKTEGHSGHADVIMPLTQNTLAIIGEKGERDEKIFKLPSYELCSRYVKMWVERAGIPKHISWHCARHSFAVNVLSGGADIETVSALLGHSSIAMTAKYLHAVPELKRKAVDILPDLPL